MIAKALARFLAIATSRKSVTSAAAPAPLKPSKPFRPFKPQGQSPHDEVWLTWRNHLNNNPNMTWPMFINDLKARNRRLDAKVAELEARLTKIQSHPRLTK
ncbi:MAG: hypothetical protein K0U74_12180 [Alphaproteobacteria bacterium]|nr:hypothetical protein [Alphaproteobacteria bacterium]